MSRKYRNITVPTKPRVAYEILYKVATAREFITVDFAAKNADHSVHSMVVLAENPTVAEKIFKSAKEISRVLTVRATNRPVTFTPFETPRQRARRFKSMYRHFSITIR